MPALWTHYKFGLDLLNNINKELKNEIESSINYYNMFNQGFDNLYYYPIHWNYYRNMAVRAHKKNIDKFFDNMITYILDNKLEDNSDLTNMVYGFINHYTVDTIIHPLVNYQVKHLNISHTKIEFSLDSPIANNYKKKDYKKVIPRLRFSKKLIGLINWTFEKTYGEKKIGKIFNRSHNNDYYIYRYFVHDSKGRKTKFYSFIDKIVRKKELNLQDNTFYIKNFDERILNKNKETWHHPKDITKEYNYSYEELYDYSIIICTKLNEMAYQVLHNKKDKDILVQLIKRISINNIQEFLDL